MEKLVELAKEEFSNLKDEIYQMIESVSETLGRKLTRNKEIEIVDRGCPHTQPSGLKNGYAAVYSFIDKDSGQFLKIGKANEKSQARYVSQHYGFSARSTLATSICEGKQMLARGVEKKDIKKWILENTQRIDILINCDNNKWATTLIEAIMQYKYMPRYEG